MADPTSEFLQDYQALARQSWDAWSRQMQASAAPPSAPWQNAGTTAASDTFERTLEGLKSYLGWMQGTTATATTPGVDWQQQVQQWFGGSGQPFTQAFAGIEGAGAQGFGRLWQEWTQAMQRGGQSMGSAPSSPTPAFGMDREQHMQQQELAQAMLASMQASARYQTLLQRASTQAVQRLQDKLAEHSEPGRQVESLKGLYDLWVDASEESYAEIALTEEFRTVYGEMVNTQMTVRQLQKKYTEAMCQQLGIPTRSEVASLGERLQAVRRELRADKSAGTVTDRIEALRGELAALARRVDARTTPKLAKQPLTAAARSAPGKDTPRKTAAGTSKPLASSRRVAPAASPPTKRVKAKASPRKPTAKAPAGKPAASKSAASKSAAGKPAASKSAASKSAASRKAATLPKARAASTSRTSSRKRK